MLRLQWPICMTDGQINGDHSELHWAAKCDTASLELAVSFTALLVKRGQTKKAIEPVQSLNRRLARLGETATSSMVMLTCSLVCLIDAMMLRPPMRRPINHCRDTFNTLHATLFSMAGSTWPPFLVGHTFLSIHHREKQFAIEPIV